MLEQLPHDLFAEDSIIGVCLLHGTETFVRARQYIRNPEIFYSEDNRAIWQAMESMYKAGTVIDEIMVCRELRKTKPLSFGGDSWATVTILRTRPVIGDQHLSGWCTAIIDDYVERISMIGTEKSRKAPSAFEKAKIIDGLMKDALEFKNVEDWADMSQIGIELIDRRERIAKGEVFGVKTGFKTFDALTGGLEPGMIIFAARPSMGKTAFAASLAVKMALNGGPVGIISLEMPRIQLGARLYSILSRVAFWRLFRNIHDTQYQTDYVNKSIAENSTVPVYVSDQTKVNLSDIRYKTEKLIRTKGAKCVIIDYIQLVNPNDDEKQARNREQQVAALSRGLKAMSTDLGIPVIALAQLNRESEKADGPSKPGKLSQLRESDSILADADMGCIVDRPFKRGELVDANGQSTENKAAIIIEKFRNGETTTLEFDFHPETMMFMDLGELDMMNNIHNDHQLKQPADFSTAPEIKPFG